MGLWSGCRLIARTKVGRWFANIGHAYCIGRTNIERLQSAVQQYELSTHIGTDPERSVSVVYELSVTLQVIYDIVGTKEDLNKSIEFGRNAVSLTPDDHPDMAMYAN